jgi:hypothetical protein
LLHEADLAHVALVRACEEADSDGRFLRFDERQRASRRVPAPPAGAGREALEAFLAARARELSGALTARWPGLRRALAAAGLPVPAWVVIVLAGLGGVTLERLGGTRRIDLLAFPLLGLMVWNLTIYLLALSRPWLRRRAGDARAESLAPPGLLQAALWMIGPERWWGRSGPADASRWVAESARRFVRHWMAIAGPLVGARAERLLHVGALSFGMGAVLGMYLRGLAVEYRAGWESTFLTAPSVAALFRVVLGPAAWILRRLAPGLMPPPSELFSVEAIERLRGPAVSGEAAVWIHLWALTTVLVVVAPRLVLAWRASRRARALAADLRLPLDDAYFLRVLAATRGAGVLVEVIPYSFRPSPAGAERAGRLLLDLYGSQARLHAPEPTGYGDPPPPAADGGQGPRRVVVMFSLAQTPELEVHGEFLDEIRRQLAASPAGGQLLVLLDDEAYRARLGDSAPRLAERRRAWERFGEECGVGVVSLSVAPADQDLLTRARDALADRPGESRA